MFELVSVDSHDVVYNLGSLPQWLIAMAAFGMFILSWRSAHNAKRAAIAASLAVAKITEVKNEVEVVHYETNSMRVQLEHSKVQEGRQQVIDETAAAAVATSAKE